MELAREPGEPLVSISSNATLSPPIGCELIHPFDHPDIW